MKAGVILMIYRREIDGLRAIAVMPVILFHAGLKVFSGGFVGVDVFFVISGYLITQVIAEDLSHRRFSLLNFYDRRARRIIPALFCVIICCLPFAWSWMLPSELISFSKSIVAVAIFSSNILFWSEEGYFSPDADLKPLLHTWSLAVEEQFYLFFPLVLICLWRYGRKNLIAIVVVLLIVSFGISEWGWRRMPSANFYLAPGRAWELLTGSLCALIPIRGNSRYYNPASILGLSLIVGSVFLYSDTTPFPSAYTLAPVLGAALIICFATRGTYAAMLLGSRPLVYIGLISYSAYLWHQPLFAFARLRSISEPSPASMAFLVLCALFMAHLSWKFVETPFRQRRRGFTESSENVFLAAGLAISVLVFIGVAGLASRGTTMRGANQVEFAKIEQRFAPNYGLSGSCEGSFTLSANCRTAENPEVLLWGDSYAMHLAPGILASAPRLKMQQHTISACSPILGMSQVEGGLSGNWGAKCIAFNDNVMNWLKNNPEVKTVILSSPFVGVTSSPLLFRDGSTWKAGDIQKVRKELLRTIDRIRSTGARVVIVSPTPVSNRDNGRCLERSAFFGKGGRPCDFRRVENTGPERLLRDAEQFVPVYWLYADLCHNGVCQTQDRGVYLFRDSGHFTREGSVQLGIRYNWFRRMSQLAR
ncbi:acyltransferase family protein [Novosphingobium jiangmenense]|uniref:Acyltransferase n=1 Tax=Novosphingobium jiangmenense TaxID=2791981 RepID=A0ABS0HLD1_9SPHN|nr:acyltransferase family protein [Novosphingobium jiangmenense]MBF9153062.1 acyltransferase [Novosphingobium jiangmenense]